MEEIKFLKQDIKKSLFITVIILAIFALLKYWEASAGLLTNFVS